MTGVTVLVTLKHCARIRAKRKNTNIGCAMRKAILMAEEE